MKTIVLACVVAVALGIPASPEVVSFVPEALPARWSMHGGVASHESTKVFVTLKQQNLDRLAEIVKQVSDPHSSVQPLSNDEVNELTKPAAVSVEAVEAWLESHQLSFSMAPTGDKFVVSGTYGEISRVFSTEFKRWGNDEGHMLTRADAFSLPKEIAEHVTAVFGLHGLPLFPRKKSPVGEFAPQLPAKVDPSVIQKTYNVGGVTVTRGTKNRQAVAEFQGQLMSESDLQKFFKEFVPNAQPGDDRVYRYYGFNRTGEGVEALLDIQYIMGVVPGIKTEFWEFKNMDFCADLKNWTTTLLSTSDIPLVHSVSYGWQGDVSQIGCTKDEVSTVDVDFQKLAAMGITIIFASGDSGSGYTPKPFHKPTLYPSWPASSPWVTAVGATQFIDNEPSKGEEAVTRFGSGGGFSEMFTAPTYQAEDTKNYLANAPDLPPTGTYPAGGRGTPDVSALGDGYQVIVDGIAQTVGGTSASAPAFAALISLINEARFAKSLKPLGFLNNWIYQNPTIFTDITVGNNRIGRSGGPSKYGYSCTKGWDPVTGQGTPKFAAMLASALSNTTVA